MTVKINTDKLIKLYTDGDYSLQQLAEHFSTSKSTIKRNLQKQGINIVNKVYKNKTNVGSNNGKWRDDIDIDTIMHKYVVENKSYTVVADEMGLDRGIVKRRLLQANIDIYRKTRRDNLGVQASMNKLYYKYQKSAEKRGYDFNIDFDVFHDTIQKPCFYCHDEKTSSEKSRAGYIYNFTGLDRVDNTKGYSVNNVVPCCKVCNQMKSNIPYDVFINQINKIYNKLI